MTHDKEISQWLEKALSEIPFSSFLSIDQFIEYAQKHNLVSRHFPILNSGFIVFNDKTIFLTSEERGTTLSTELMWG